MAGIFTALDMYICHPYVTDYIKIVQQCAHVVVLKGFVDEEVFYRKEKNLETIDLGIKCPSNLRVFYSLIQAKYDSVIKNYTSHCPIQYPIVT